MRVLWRTGEPQTGGKPVEVKALLKRCRANRVLPAQRHHQDAKDNVRSGKICATARILPLRTEPDAWQSSSKKMALAQDVSANFIVL